MKGNRYHQPSSPLPVNLTTQSNFNLMKNEKPVKNQGAAQGALEIQCNSLENNASNYTLALVHELRNPLNAIMLSVESLQEKLGSNVDDKIFLDIIWRGAKRINSLVTSILESSKFDTNDRIEYSLHRLLDEVLEVVADRINIKGIALCKNYGKHDFKALINEQEMKIALTNIIINAVEAMATNNGQLSVVTKSVSGGDQFVLQIEDNGHGIGEKNLKNLFTSHVTTKKRGMGFGLAATYEILNSNHVEVSVKSREGIGTCFRLLFDTV